MGKALQNLKALTLQNIAHLAGQDPAENQGGLKSANRRTPSTESAATAAAAVMTTGMPWVRISSRNFSASSSAAPRT